MGRNVPGCRKAQWNRQKKLRSVPQIAISTVSMAGFQMAFEYSQSGGIILDL